MQDAKVQIFQTDLYNNDVTVWPRTTKLSSITQLGRSIFQGGQPHPNRNGMVPQRSQFWKFLYIYTYTLWRRTTKFDAVRHGEGLVSRGRPSATPLPQRGGVPALPNFGGSFCLCIHPLFQNYQIWRDVGRGTRVSWGQPRLPSQESGVPELPNF